MNKYTAEQFREQAAYHRSGGHDGKLHGNPADLLEFAAQQLEAAQEVQRDAERYRWLRDREIPKSPIIVDVWDGGNWVPIMRCELDGYIDAAIASKEKDRGR